MTRRNKEKLFPDFFTAKGPFEWHVTPAKYREKMCWFMNLDENELLDEKEGNTTTLAPYKDNEDEIIACGDVDESYDISVTKSGKFTTSFYVPGPLQSVIIGTKGRVLKDLQDRTKTIIKVPRINEKGDVRVTGSSERNVASARNQIEMIVLNKRNRMDVTHFISIPILSEEIRRSFKTFQEEILGDPPIKGIDESIFQNPNKLHLTIVTLTIFENELEDIKNVLEAFFQNESNKKILNKLKGSKLFIRGVEIMNDDPTDVKVLYGKVHLESTELKNEFQAFCNSILDHLYKKGLIKKQYDNVKLHLTLMNAAFRRKSDDYDRRSQTGSFDASFLMQKYKNYEFGASIFNCMHLSTL